MFVHMLCGVYRLCRKYMIMIISYHVGHCIVSTHIQGYGNVTVPSTALSGKQNDTLVTHARAHTHTHTQVLKYESHLDCPLVQFILDRSWKNKRIGHYLFWHLRAELDSPEVTLRFGLILESYLRGSPNHIAELQRQVDGMAKMRNISELLQSRQFKDRVSPVT